MNTLAIFGIIGVLYAVIMVYSFSLTARRWHDLGYSGWLSLLSIVPVINIVTAIILIFIRGTEGDNQYGSSNVGKPFWSSVFGSNKQTASASSVLTAPPAPVPVPMPPPVVPSPAPVSEPTPAAPQAPAPTPTDTGAH